MHSSFRFPLSVALFLLIITAKAQDKPADAPIEKYYTSNIWLVGVRGEYYFKKNSCVFFSSDYNFNDQYRYRITNSTRLYNRLGLEMNAGGKWYVGGSIAHRLAYDPGLNMLSGKFNVSHRGDLRSIKLIKELSFEYIHHFNYPFFDTKRDFQVGIGAGAFKSFKVAKRDLGFLVSYKVILNSNLEFDIYKDRKIDFTKLRLDVTYGLSKNVYIGIFAMRETEYFYPPGTSDILGNNIYYKVNSVNPIYGCSLSFILHPENIESYIPNLPLR